jgi:DNA/RNA-binding domain of Phe-tRNA-synthetase-like protein
VWRDFPELVPGVLYVEGLSAEVSVGERLGRYQDVATGRLAHGVESELPEVQAWRRAFAKMGLKPTQYRCASESLLRRFRKEGALPSIHPLIDLCNAMSLAYAVPIAVFDADQVTEFIEVRYAAGEERYLTFSGEIEQPETGEVIFADGEGRAHARRWTNRQSGWSAMRAETTRALIVAEALHRTAGEDVPRLIETLAEELQGTWGVEPMSAVLTATARTFKF